MNKHGFIILALLMAAACSNGDDAETGDVRTIPVTVAEVRTGDVEVLERTVGRIEATAAPWVGAEVPGRVVAIHKDAGDTVGAGEILARIDESDYLNALEQAQAALQRAEALHAQHERTVQRFRRLIEQESAAQSALDDAEAQLASTVAQVREVKARLSDARTALQRTRVTAPVDGIIQERMVSAGDYTRVGDPLYRMTATERLRVVLPFPERLSESLSVGQSVYLSLAGREERIRARISEIRPMIGAANQSLDAIVELDNPGGWRPGASADASVVLAVRDGQALVPATAVVQRPAGKVVYLVEDGIAHQRVVRVGVALDGDLEILEGLTPGQRIAVDGAGFLSDGARVTIKDD